MNLKKGDLVRDIEYTQCETFGIITDVKHIIIGSNVDGERVPHYNVHWFKHYAVEANKEEIDIQHDSLTKAKRDETKER